MKFSLLVKAVASSTQPLLYNVFCRVLWKQLLSCIGDWPSPGGKSQDISASAALSFLFQCGYGMSLNFSRGNTNSPENSFNIVFDDKIFYIFLHTLVSGENEILVLMGLTSTLLKVICNCDSNSLSVTGIIPTELHYNSFNLPWGPLSIWTVLAFKKNSLIFTSVAVHTF